MLRIITDFDAIEMMTNKINRIVDEVNLSFKS